MAKDTRMGMPGGGTGSSSTGAMRGKKTSKGIIKNPLVPGVETGSKITTGKFKAIKRNNKVKDFDVNITKGKNKNWAKDANKITLPSSTKSKRANAKEANFYSRLSKHPLVRNAGEASAETKYRVNRGKPVPVKPKNKTPNTAAKGAAFGKKPSARGGMRGGGLGGLNKANR